MANKTIYVADIDLPVFDRAQELAGENLSATIAQALRHFIAAEEARTRGFGEITLKVGLQMNYTRKQFLGRELARHTEPAAESGRLVTQTVFQTAKGRFVLYTRAQPDWSAFADFWGNWGQEFARGFGKDFGKDFAKDWGKDWGKDWDFGVVFGREQGGSDTEGQARAQARAEARAQARAAAQARREEWRERARQAHAEARGAARDDERGGPRFDCSNLADGGDYDMEVYDTLDDLKPHISPALFAAVERALKGEDVEFLDI